MIKTSPKYKLEYRASVDGLRSIAVLAVVFFHFFPRNLKGGFVGVDVFFVISGYLVSGTIFKALEPGEFGILNFYQKRINRLFPAFLFVLTCSLVFAVSTLLSEELKAFSLHLTSGTFFFSNILYFSESGYFDKSSELKSLLHLWSLSLEEQFYFVWPFILILFFKFKNKMKEKFLEISLLLLCLISFIGCAYYSDKNPTFAFFILLTRFWELGLGGLFYLIHNEENNRKLFKKYASLRYDLVGLALLVYSFIAFSSKTVFPGFAALVPVVGTLLLVIAPDDTFTNKWLQHPIAVYIGKISYPLYLWHWPLFSFGYLISGADLSHLSRAFLMGLSFILAIFTHELIEKKSYALTKKIPQLVVVLFLFNIMLGLTGSYIYKSNGLPLRLPQYERNLLSKEAYKQSTNKDQRSKFCDSREIQGIEICNLSKTEHDPSVVIIGDSHANHYFPGLKKYYDKRGENLLLLAKNGTSPLYNVRSKRKPDTSLDDAFALISKSETIHTVILSAFWSNYYEEKGTFVSGAFYKNRIYSPVISSTDQSLIFKLSLEKTLDHLKQANKKVIFYYDIPALDFPLESYVGRPLRSEIKTYASKLEDKKQNGYRVAVAPILLKYNITTYDPLKFICGENQCNILLDGNFIFSDSHHLSIWGSNYITSRILEL